MALRYSQLKDKPLHRLNALTTKLFRRIFELDAIIINSKKFGIPITEEAIKAGNYWTYFRVTGLIHNKHAEFNVYDSREIVRLSREVDMGTTVFREADVPFEVTLEWLCEMLEQNRLFLNS